MPNGLVLVSDWQNRLIVDKKFKKKYPRELLERIMLIVDKSF